MSVLLELGVAGASFAGSWLAGLVRPSRKKSTPDHTHLWTVTGTSFQEPSSAWQFQASGRKQDQLRMGVTTVSFVCETCGEIRTDQHLGLVKTVDPKDTIVGKLRG